MSRQEEDFKSRAKYFVDKAARESGPYRDVLLGVAEGFAVLAVHQAALDEWPRRYPGPVRQAQHESLLQASRQELREPQRQMPAQALARTTQTQTDAPRPMPNRTPSQGTGQMAREAPRGTAAPIASPKR